MGEPCDLSAVEMRRLIGARALSPVELVRSCLARIAAVNPAVNAVVTLDEEGALAAARLAEAAVMRGEALGVLHGLPLGIKDMDDTAGLRTTYGSAAFASHVPVRDLGVVARLKAAGGIVLGKTNTPEFAAGANTRNTVFGATGNPFDPARSAAGSSGGSAAALACAMVPLASGSDTGGSLRNPAAHCGIVGLRPSPGVVPNETRGFGWSGLPVNGPMARSVGDAALLLSAMAGDDARDPLAYTLPGEAVRGRAGRWWPVGGAPGAAGSAGAGPGGTGPGGTGPGGTGLGGAGEGLLGGLRVAVTEDFGFAPVEAHVRRVFRARVAALSPLFARVEEGSPDCTGADDAFAVLRASLFLGSFLERYRARPETLGPNVRANVEEGLGYTLGDFARAGVAQTRIYRSFVGFFAGHDVLLSPAISVSPRPWRELYPVQIDGVATRSYFHWLALAYGVTLAGHPALSLPLGVDEAGMPFGVQVVGPRGGDALVLAVAAAIEAACAGDAVLRRPVPDLAMLAAAAPISGAEGFLEVG